MSEKVKATKKSGSHEKIGAAHKAYGKELRMGVDSSWD